MPSTPKHLHLYRAFDWDPPAFAHVGLLQDTDRQKLSKRDHRTDLNTLKKDGFIAEAIMNSVALLGWSHPLRSDILSPQELIDNVRTDLMIGFSFDTNQALVQSQVYQGKRSRELCQAPLSSRTSFPKNISTRG